MDDFQDEAIVGMKAFFWKWDLLPKILRLD
jgi:hypothetical protein